MPGRRFGAKTTLSSSVELQRLLRESHREDFSYGRQRPPPQGGDQLVNLLSGMVRVDRPESKREKWSTRSVNEGFASSCFGQRKTFIRLQRKLARILTKFRSIGESKRDNKSFGDTEWGEIMYIKNNKQANPGQTN